MSNKQQSVKEVKEVEEKVKLELETIYKDDRKLDISLLTKLLNIPQSDVENILGVSHK
jgi:hypothetical protein